MGGSNSKDNTKRQGPKLSPKRQGRRGRRSRTAHDDSTRSSNGSQPCPCLAVNLARARDSIMVFGSAWMTLVVSAGTAKAAGRHVPPVIAAPVVLAALLLGNLADMAYGNKLNRVVKEAEYI